MSTNYYLSSGDNRLHHFLESRSNLLDLVLPGLAQELFDKIDGLLKQLNIIYFSGLFEPLVMLDIPDHYLLLRQLPQVWLNGSRETLFNILVYLGDKTFYQIVHEGKDLFVCELWLLKVCSRILYGCEAFYEGNVRGLLQVEFLLEVLFEKCLQNIFFIHGSYRRSVFFKIKLTALLGTLILAFLLRTRLDKERSPPCSGLKIL